MIVRDARLDDVSTWAAMRARLWPDAEAAELASELPAMLADPTLWNFILTDTGDRAVGFAEVQLRTMFDGCAVPPYPHIEGLWVDAALRRRGGARALLAAIEARARERGHDRVGSDVELDNIISQTWHETSGFKEEARTILYSKPL
ncbi:GNAT family N-acetyltransferase [Sphingopyxis sp. LK2115]|jgi:aminoglycoside 6'-N-acetyltransferase I|uniref:GNAT family N-acetyltransferase n=1 Tax=Sphingopyxis sp. LK2115 TaxID=2744558 RepID=UPI0016606D7B|nr:GNAT family N-acetyltransferase [Sphingopyxis sp. LK2115]